MFTRKKINFYFSVFENGFAAYCTRAEIALKNRLNRQAQQARRVVVRAWLIMIVQVTIWYIPRHDHLQFVNQLRETGTRRWIFIPAQTHQFISIKD